MATGMTRNIDSLPVSRGLDAYPAFAKLLRRELVLIHDDNAAGLQVRQTDLQGRRIHGHEHVRRIAWRANLVIAKTKLKTADPFQRPRRRSNLGRKIGKRTNDGPDP